MNFKLLALGIIGITFLFQLYVEWLQMKSAEGAIPENVKDVYDNESYRKWLRYYREKTKLSFFRHLVSYIVTFLVVGFDIFANIVRSLSLEGSYAAAIGVLAADMLIGLIFGIPFSYVNSMVVEQKYGFNKMTKKTFIFDHIKCFVIELSVLC